MNMIISTALWTKAASYVKTDQGILVIDDSTLDKSYAQQMELVTRHWSGKHQQVVCGINRITLMWTDGDSQIPCDYRLYNKQQDNLTKNDHFQALRSYALQIVVACFLVPPVPIYRGLVGVS